MGFAKAGGAAELFYRETVSKLDPADIRNYRNGFIYVDYALPVDVVRTELERILKTTEMWNGKTCVPQVTEFTESTMQLRCLMSANSSVVAFELRCLVREQMIRFLQQN